MIKSLRPYLFTVPANIALITAGSFIFAVGLKAVALPHGLITGSFTAAPPISTAGGLTAAGVSGS